MDEKLSENILSGLDGVVTINGSINQTQAITGPEKQKKYNLTYDAIELNGIKNYFLIHLTFEDGTINTYFLPIQFLGLQKVVFEVPFPVASIQFNIYGNLKLKDTFLKSLIADPLTEEQKQALNKVTTNSEYWDRIIAVTNSLGNVITDKLEGSINTALNTITGASGKMYWEDGKFICRDATTDEESTMAMMISPGGFMIADSKKADGTWDWRTFGTGKGFVADEIIAGTLRAIAVEGVSITGSTLTGGTIIGATIQGGSLNIADKYIVDSDGDVQMLGAITWGADNSPVKVKYSSDDTNWHYDFQSADTFAKYSYDGGLTWTQGIKIKGTDGINGLPGSDANVPPYITSTKITGTTIESCTIVGNTITGNTIIYSGDIAGGNYVEISPNNPIKVWKNKKLVSSLGYSAIGGGNLTIYDVGGQEAFKVECLDNGNLRLYGNDTPGFLPDPDHPGFVIPNPNPRYMEIKSGRVIFEAGSAGVMRGGNFRRFADLEDLSIKCAPRFHKHETGYASGHTHSVNSSYDIVDPY